MSFKNCEWWKSQGLGMNTTSNEACKFFDLTLDQLVTWKEDDQFGGIDGSIARIMSADENFVMGHVIKSGLELIGSSNGFHENNPQLIDHLLNLVKKYQKDLTKRELLHVDAIKNLHYGNLDKSCDIWESILVQHPNDMLAIKFSHDTYFYTGQHAQMRDSISRILPFWQSDVKMSGYLQGMHSFGYVQSNFFQEAKESALRALEINRNDGWATHTICHFNEYRNNFNEGIKFLRNTETDWSGCNLISPHNYWHLALYHIERGEHQAALEIFDQNITQYLELNRTLDMVDVISLLYRLKLDNCKIDLSERWSRLMDVFRNRISDHGYIFNDMHLILMLCSCKDKQGEKEFFDSLIRYLNKDNQDVVIDYCNNVIGMKNTENYIKKINRNIGVNIFDGIKHFELSEYDKVVDCLRPIRYDIVKIGGSNAQRDLLNQILVHSALLSSNEENKKFGLGLINERFGLKPDSNLTKRIQTRLLLH
ncbi:tetratricopeptide repeat 38 [Brachionus plicatilis]|uniref:Tetratricopeptide repeat protein 38 n=1 Tax=Brachionus plicatilis TaxID=10195 RepID=A0A3M7TAH3_BRAPC|nr:tetratricopeptide repeat 38 [Brachionus plicatilis]